MTAWIPVLAMMGGPSDGQPQSPLLMFGYLALMIAVFYFILIRPQQRREKERRAMIERAKTGDRIVFAGGILGVVSNVKDKTLVVKIADNVKIEVGKYAVTQVLEKGSDPADEPSR